jgi:hypothetical protein
LLPSGVPAMIATRLQAFVASVIIVKAWGRIVAGGA